MKPQRTLFLAGAGVVLLAALLRNHREVQGIALCLALLAVNFALMLGWRKNKS